MKVLRFRRERLLLLVALLTLLTAIPASPARPMPTMAQSADDPIPEDEIVYVGQDEHIYVFDPNTKGDDKLLEWASPDSDWRWFDLGDFNDDGDMEIIAVGGDTDTGKVAIFDPVDRSGQPDGSFNDVPWRELYRASVEGRPEIVKAGNFDAGLPGDEFIIGYEIEDGARFQLSVFKSAKPNPDGTEWVKHIKDKDDGNKWTFIESGNLDNIGNDEVALIDEDGGEINVFKLQDGWQRFYNDSSSNNPYRAVTFGDFFAGGNKEVMFSRNHDSLPNLFITTFVGGDDPTLEEKNDPIFKPYPRFLFVADVNGSGDDELFFLRRDEAPRMIGINDGGDPMPTMEEDLDDDDGYRAGTGGDVDGDGNQEVIIIRDDKIRIYENRISRWAVREEIVKAETKIIRAGDLDGGATRPTFAFSVDAVEQTLATGTSIAAREYRLSNGGNDEVIEFSYLVADNVDWVDINIPTPHRVSSASPAKVFIAFDATQLEPGRYATNITFTATSPSTTSNSPYVVPIVLTVKEADIAPSPSSYWFKLYGCEDGLAPMTTTIAIGGTTGVHYNAAIIDQPRMAAAQAGLEGVNAAEIVDGLLTLEDKAGNRATFTLPSESEIRASDTSTKTWPSGADWLTATYESAMVPDTITITADPQEVPQGSWQAVLVLVGDEEAGSAPTNVRIVPLNLICINSEIFVPSITTIPFTQ